MKLDQNNPDRANTNKYALVKMRRVWEIREGADDQKAQQMGQALTVLSGLGILEYDEPGADNEFFVMRLKDVHSRAGLLGYAASAMADGDKEYGQDVLKMADRAGERHPNAKHPD